MLDLEPLDVQVFQNVGSDLIHANSEASAKLGLPELAVSPARDGMVCIVGGGPSLADNLHILQAMQRDRGAKVWAINGAHDWLRDRGIHADGMVMVDARAENSRFVQCPIPEATYYISHRCHPDVYAALKGAKVVRVLLTQSDFGSTSGTLAMCVAFCEGYRDIRLFGFDSSYREGEAHAYTDNANAGEPVGEYWCAGRKFLAAPWMAKQVEDFEHLAADMANNGAEIMVYGDGLLPTVAKVLGDPQSEHRWSANTIGTAYYDLSLNPPTFNFIDFLLAAEAWRLRLGLDRIEVKVLPGPRDGFRDDNLPPYGKAERTRWLNNIVLPLAALLPSCGKPAEVVERAHVPPGPHFGRGKYCIGTSVAVAAAKENIYPLRTNPAAADDCRELYGRYVTITLRNPGWWPGRTSNVAEWLKVAEAIRARGYRVIFLPDDRSAKIEGYDVLHVPRSDSRSWLYAGSELNMGINGGPMQLSWFMGVPTLAFYRTNENEPSSTKARFIADGLPPGSQFANARPKQRIVWAMDDAETVLKAFDEVMA